MEGGFDGDDAVRVVEGVVGIRVVGREGDATSGCQLAPFLHAVESQREVASGVGGVDDFDNVAAGGVVDDRRGVESALTFRSDDGRAGEC